MWVDEVARGLDFFQSETVRITSIAGLFSCFFCFMTVLQKNI